MPLSRKKSCTQCRIAKARCNLNLPSCSRCSQRALSCEYEYSSGLRSTDAMRRTGSGAETDPRDTTDVVCPISPKAPDPAKSTAAGVLDDAMNAEIYDHVFMGNIREMESGLAGSNCDVPNLSAPPLVDTSTIPAAAEADVEFYRVNGFFETPSQRILPASMLSLPPTTHALTSLSRGHALNSPAIGHTAASAASPTDIAFPQLRGAASMDASLTALSILGQLKLYPKLLISGGTLPPFIHAGCLVGDLTVGCGTSGCHECLPKSLANCATLTQMFYSKTVASSELVWVTVKTELLRLYNEFRGYDANALLAAVQSATVYILLLVLEPTADNDLVSFVFLATWDMCTRLYEEYYHPKGRTTPAFPTRTEWIFHESMRRVVCVLGTLDLILNVNYGPTGRAACDGPDSLPLPCIRDLWHAKDDKTWQQEFMTYLNQKHYSGSLSVKHLRSSSTGIRRSTKQDHALSEWSMNLDSFGMVVMSVARLGMDDQRQLIVNT